MVTPDRRRIAVERVQVRFGVSERRACRVVGQHRSTQRRPKARPDDAEGRLREHLRGFARCHPRLGWRKAHAVAHREGLVTNPKRTRRIWRDERLQRPPQRKAKRRRLTDGTAARLRAEAPNDVWALDFQFDETADLRRIKLLNIVDEFTREALCVDAAHSINADGVVDEPPWLSRRVLSLGKREYGYAYTDISGTSFHEEVLGHREGPGGAAGSPVARRVGH